MARAIHDWSSRKNGPFVVVSCTAVSDTLLGRELFGCSESAHPSLPEEYAGALMRAAGGTLLPIITSMRCLDSAWKYFST